MHFLTTTAICEYKNKCLPYRLAIVEASEEANLEEYILNISYSVKSAVANEVKRIKTIVYHKQLSIEKKKQNTVVEMPTASYNRD